MAALARIARILKGLFINLLIRFIYLGLGSVFRSFSCLTYSNQITQTRIKEDVINAACTFVPQHLHLGSTLNWAIRLHCQAVKIPPRINQDLFIKKLVYTSIVK